MNFVGFVTAEDTIHLAVQVRNGDLPVNADAFPTFRVYSSSGILVNAGGTATYRHTGTITAATNASPIVVTSAGHNLQTGSRVNITGVLGNTAANGTFTVTRVDADTFSLDGSTGNGAYSSGGTFRVAGFYDLQIDATSAKGFTAGETYVVHATWEVSSAAYAEVLSIGVV